MTSMFVKIPDLAESIRPVAEHLGVDAARALVAAFGGTEVYVPATLRDDHPLTVIGHDLAVALCRNFGGEVVAVPKEMLTAAARHRLAGELAKEGMRTAEIARTLGLTERHIYKLLRTTPRPKAMRRPLDSRQITIFDFTGE
ncbi:Mor transcription activator family protein [Camelimonas lactis]|uniref:Mor transcription activator family protein n=1 Tax=Camelimonas lactis TaxID=659006 RepID=A0A4R2GW22_9HYPH|nr:Mor transcription activator family protein [Camelimonas lactis]TCO15201.1 Mor transcription activator family protein [Camelimonas lactis]